MANTDEFDDNGDRRKKRGVGFYVAGALALTAASGFGYWTATKPKQISELAAQQVEEPAKTAEVAQPIAEPPAVETKTASAEPMAEVAVEAQVAVPEQPVANQEQAVVPTPPAAPKVEATAPVEQAVAAAPTTEPAPKPVEPAPAPEQQQAAIQTEPPPAPAKVEALVVEEPSDAPSFDTVRVEPNGDTLIAGRAKPGTEVAVMHNGSVIGKTTANADGAFVLVPDKPLPVGTGSLTLETKVGDKIVASLGAVAVAVKEQAKGEAMVAVVTPDKPAEIIQAPSTSDTAAPSGKVVLDSVDYDDQGSIIFSGRSIPENMVRLYVDNSLAGEVKTGVDGKWTFDGKSGIEPGTHTLRADEIDGSGKVVSRVELPFLREEQQKVALAQAETAESGTQAKIGVSTGEQAAVPQRIVIQPGNNLWRLSRIVYGKGTRYTVIYEANKDQIRNPDLIYPGQVFAVPVTP